MNDFPWLTALMVVPVLGAVGVMALPTQRGGSGSALPGDRDGTGSAAPKQLALAVSLLTLGLAAVVALRFDPGGERFQLTELQPWIEAFGASYSLGVDGIGLTLVLLTAVLTPVVILASWNDGDRGRWSTNAFFAWMLALEGLAMGVFCATDVLLFYVLFEATLIPVYFLIGGFGGPRRQYAAVKFLLYNLFGGLMMLASVVGLYAVSADAGSPTYLLSELGELEIGTGLERWLFAGFFLSFAIKAPLFPLHTWLPDAAEQATPGTQVLMVSVLDKIGTFGMIRFCLELFPNASVWATPFVLVLATISILYGGLLAIAQQHLSRLIAFTSVSHFGFIVLGIFVLNSYGQAGSTLYMFNHGLSTAALFLVAGFLVARRGSAMVGDFGGVEKVAPVLAGLFLVAGLSTLSLPGLSPFVSEYLVLAGAFAYSWWYAAFAVLGIVLAALYILLAYQRTMTGPTRPDVAGLPDLNRREVAALAPLVALIVGLGFYPQPLLEVINPAVDHTLTEIGAEDPEPAVAPAAVKETEQ